MEKEKKRLNIVISGQEKDMIGTKIKIEKWMQENLKIDIELEEVWIMGKEKK